MAVESPRATHSRSKIEAYERLLETFSSALNHMHGIEVSRRFWEILLYRFFRRCTTLFDLGILQNMARPKRIPDDSFLDLDVVDAVKSKPGWANFISLTPIVGAMRSGARKASGSGTVAVNPFSSGNFLAARSILGGFHYREPVVGRVDPPIAMLCALEWPEGFEREERKREFLRDFEKGCDWELARLVARFMPDLYVEEFRGRFEWARVVAPETREFHASFLSRWQDRFVIARYAEEGSKLNIYQHAAGYGEVADHFYYHVEGGVSDRFYTWGWRIRDNDVPFVALRLLRPRVRVEDDPRGGECILYVHVRPAYDWNVPDTLALQDGFLSALSDKNRMDTIIRGRDLSGRGGAGFGNKGALGPVRMLDSGQASMGKLMGLSRVVVVDMMPTTVFPECLIRGKPVVAIVPGIGGFTKIAQRLYGEFFRLGIFHETAESAAKFLNAIDVGSWWRRVMRDNAVKDYMSTFCRTEID